MKSTRRQFLKTVAALPVALPAAQEALTSGLQVGVEPGTVHCLPEFSTVFVVVQESVIEAKIIDAFTMKLEKDIAEILAIPASFFIEDVNQVRTQSSSGRAFSFVDGGVQRSNSNRLQDPASRLRQLES